MEDKPRKRGGNVKKVAPEGFYTAAQAIRVLGLNKRSFYDYVNAGKIKKYVPSLRKEGFYSKWQIDALADETTLIFLQALTEDELEPMEFRAATSEDAQGIVNVLASRGWKTTSAELRKSWYRVNPYIDYVVTQNGIIVGYVNITSYIPEVLTAIMAGLKRGWDILPTDILPYLPGHTYDVFTGLAEHKDAPDRARVGRRLMLGVFGHNGVLQQWAKAGIIIRRMYGTSAEEDGKKVAKLLGFEQELGQPGDLFGRFVLDLETSDSHFARQYRESIKQ